MKKFKILLITILMIVSTTSAAFAAGSPTKRPIGIIDSNGDYTNQTGVDDDGGLVLTIPGKEDSIHSSSEDSDFLKRVKKELSTVNDSNEISVSTDVAASADTTTTAGNLNNKLVTIVEIEVGLEDGGLLIKRTPIAGKEISFVKPIEPNIGLSDINNASAYVITSKDVLNNNEAINEITKAALEENRKVFNYERAVDESGNVIGVINSNNEVLDVKTSEVIGNVADDGVVTDLKGNVIANKQNVLEVSHIIEKAICAIDENGNIYGWYNAEKDAFINDEGEVIGYLTNNYWTKEDGEIVGGTGYYDQYVEYEYVVLDSFDLHYWGNMADKKEPPEEVTIYVEGVNYGDEIIVHHELSDKSIVIEDAEVIDNNTIRIYNLKSFSLFSVSKKQKVVYEEELTDVFQPSFGCSCFRIIGATILLNILIIVAIIVALVLKRNREDKYDY